MTMVWIASCEHVGERRLFRRRTAIGVLAETRDDCAFEARVENGDGLPRAATRDVQYLEHRQQTLGVASIPAVHRNEVTTAVTDEHEPKPSAGLHLRHEPSERAQNRRARRTRIVE